MMRYGKELPGPTTDRYIVDQKKLEDFYEKLYLLLDQEFGHDCDGDANVECILIDRERFQSLHFFPLPYSHKLKDGVEAAEKHYDVAKMNLRLAWDAWDSAERMLEHERRVEQNRRDKK